MTEFYTIRNKIDGTYYSGHSPSKSSWAYSKGRRKWVEFKRAKSYMVKGGAKSAISNMNLKNCEIVTFTTTETATEDYGKQTEPLCDGHAVQNHPEHGKVKVVGCTCSLQLGDER